LPRLEHVALGQARHRVAILAPRGIRRAGLTYTRKHDSGDGQYAHHDGGLSDGGIAGVRCMHALGMDLALSHAACQTAMDAIPVADAPVGFSHHAAHTVRPVPRGRPAEARRTCAQQGVSSP
jgi:membrane dipeptidase